MILIKIKKTQHIITQITARLAKRLGYSDDTKESATFN